MGYLHQPHSWMLCARLHRNWTALVALAVLEAAGATLTVNAAYQAPASGTNPPANYYANATGTGSTLRMSLHNIISTGFVQQSYTAAETALTDTDKDPNNASDILTIYDRTSLSKVWNPNASTGWNREHQWPASRINGATSGPTADLFELRPAAETTNGGRGNLPYGGGATASGDPNVVTNSYFFPGDTDKGDVSRAMFYMATMYYTGSATLSSTNLQLVNGYAIGSLPDYKMGDLASMLAWNYQDNVDTFERNRNQQIYNNTGHPSLSQKNRNPYVDHPEYVWAVWGDRLNNSQISVGTPAADGSSTANVSVGRIMANGTFSTSTATFTKTGYTPTTFDITTAGNATIPNAVVSSNLLINGSAPAGYLIAGAGQGIDFNAQTRQIVVGLSASTSTTGLKSGTVTIHNTDLTTAAAGQGAADGNDTINVTGTVLAKRSVTLSTGTLSFGTVITGANVAGNITLSTSGDDNNFTRVTVAGTSTSDANGVAVSGSSALFNAANVTGTRTVGGTLTSVGSKNGTLSLSVVTAENGGSGISGEGTYSPINIGYSATVLGHATPSFSPTVSSGNLTLNFPTVAYNAAAPSQGFSLANVVATNAAGLDFTGYTLTGSTAFSTDLATFLDDPQGTAHNFTAALTTSTLGTFTATYTLNFSDEQDLPGATVTGPLILTLNGSVGLPGDANLDGTIDLNDLNTVLNNLGGTTSAWSAGNFDGAATIDLNDLNTVLNNLGTGAPTIAAGMAEAHALLGAAAAPEPASLALVMLGLPLLMKGRRRDRDVFRGR